MASTPDDGAVSDDGASSGAAHDDGRAHGRASDVAPDDGALHGETSDDGATRAPESRTVPSQDELERLAVDVRIRRRPRYGVFVVLGMIAAGVAALLWTTSVPQEEHVNWGATVWVTTLGSLGFGALLGAGVAVFADWLSRRK